ncbi:MAG: AMP-binding protein [Acidobacteriota bacterium]|nr:AMP-binding protein [Acidobacteriota bacterium]
MRPEVRPSYAQGPPLPLIEKPIHRLLREAAHNRPCALALIARHQNVHLNFQELQEKVERTASGLWRLGIRPKDRIGMWAANCAEWVYLQVAASLIGAVLVNVNPAYRSHELRFVLGKSGMKAIFFQDRDANTDYSAVLDEARATETLPLEHAIALGSAEWLAILDCRDRAVDLPNLSSSMDDAVNIQYTSGTTGSPKGVLLTHRNLVNNAWLTGHLLRVSESDILCAPVPLYHCFGSVFGVLMCLAWGIALVLPSSRFNPLATLEAVEAERCTILYGVPTMFIAQLDHPEFRRFDLTSLRTGIMAGAPCPIEVMRRVIDDMHCRQITIVYGQTESSPAITGSSVDDDIETRVSTVGRAFPNTEIKVIDPASGETVDIGVKGELCTRGYLVMKGYDDDAPATARAVDPERWLHTGDLATMRSDGCIHIGGRLTELIIRGGENIYPREIEEFLHTHPRIADVYVTGLPDERLGETVLAWIKLRPGETATEADICSFCRDRIARYKIPQYIRFVDNFPMTVSGKVQKFKMREQEIAERGLEKAAAIRTA